MQRQPKKREDRCAEPVKKDCKPGRAGLLSPVFRACVCNRLEEWTAAKASGKKRVAARARMTLKMKMTICSDPFSAWIEKHEATLRENQALKEREQALRQEVDARRRSCQNRGRGHLPHACRH